MVAGLCNDLMGEIHEDYGPVYFRILQKEATQALFTHIIASQFYHVTDALKEVHKEVEQDFKEPTEDPATTAWKRSLVVENAGEVDKCVKRQQRHEHNKNGKKKSNNHSHAPHVQDAKYRRVLEAGPIVTPNMEERQRRHQQVAATIHKALGIEQRHFNCPFCSSSRAGAMRWGGRVACAPVRPSARGGQRGRDGATSRGERAASESLRARWSPGGGAGAEEVDDVGRRAQELEGCDAGVEVPRVGSAHCRVQDRQHAPRPDDRRVHRHLPSFSDNVLPCSKHSLYW